MDSSKDLQIMIPAEEVEKIKNHFGITHEKLELILKHAITEELETSDGYTNYNYGDDGYWPRFILPYSTNVPYQQDLLEWNLVQGDKRVVSNQNLNSRDDTFRRGREAYMKLSREEKDEWITKWKNSGRPKGQRMRFTDLLDAEEGNAPIQEPMELGEMANWTPLDGSEGLKRKRAENDDYVFCEGCGEERKSVGPDSVFTIDNAREDVLDDGNVLCDRCHTRGYKIERDAESPSATIPVNYPKHLRPDWQKTPASDKQIAREMRQAIETGNNADMMALQDKYGDYWNDKGFKKAFKKEMEGSELSWVKPVATALGFGLGFLGIKQLKKEL